jgi:hypothetical protein
LTTKTKALIIVAYLYCGLQIACWWVRLHTGGSEDWLPTFERVALVVRPLDLVSLGVCRMFWGSYNLFAARPVVGLFADVALVSLLVTSAAIGAVALAYRRLAK